MTMRIPVFKSNYVGPNSLKPGQFRGYANYSGNVAYSGKVDYSGTVDYSGSAEYRGKDNRSKVVDNGDGTSTTYYQNGSYFTCDGETFANMYNSSDQLVFEWHKVRDKNGNLTSDISISYEYGDNGERIQERVYDHLKDEVTYMRYDANGNRTEKVTKRGAVETYYDANDKPIRREIDKGQGIIVTEDLSE